MAYFKADKFITQNNVKGTTEITKQEYTEIQKRIKAVRNYLDKVLHDEIEMDDVPEIYRSDVEKNIKIIQDSEVMG